MAVKAKPQEEATPELQSLKLAPAVKGAPRLLTPDSILESSADKDIPDGAVMQLHNGDWCDKAMTIQVLEAQGIRCAKKMRRKDYDDIAGAAARNAVLRDKCKEVRDGKAAPFKLADLVHAEILPLSDDQTDADIELGWEK